MPTLDELGPPDLDLTLTAGDCLYLPRGFPHAAETVDASSSHLTIGVLALTWQQAVKHAVDVAVSDGSLRESIRPASPDRPGLEELVAHLGPDAVARWIAARGLAAPAGDAAAPARSARRRCGDAARADARPAAVAVPCVANGASSDSATAR